MRPYRIIWAHTGYRLTKVGDLESILGRSLSSKRRSAPNWESLKIKAYLTWSIGSRFSLETPFGLIEYIVDAKRRQHFKEKESSTERYRQGSKFLIPTQ